MSKEIGNLDNFPEGATHFALLEDRPRKGPVRERVIYYKHDKGDWFYISNYNKDTNNEWIECLNPPTVTLVKLFAY